MRLTGLSRFVKKKKKEKKTTEDREHDEEFGMPKAFASQLIQLKSLGWPNGFSMLQRNMFLRLRANLQRLCETWELGQLICPPFLILRILICIKNSRSNGTLVYHRDYLLFVYLPTSWIILVPCVFSRLPWIPMGLLMSMPGLVRLRFDLSNLVDGWRLQVERAGLVVVSAFGHIFSSTTTSQEAHGLHKTWNATQLLNIIIAVITAVISGESWQSACMAMDGHAYLPKYTPLLGQTSFFIPSRLLHWDGRLRISIENDDPFPVRLEFILFSCTEPWSQRRSSVASFKKPNTSRCYPVPFFRRFTDFCVIFSTFFVMWHREMIPFLNFSPHLEGPLVSITCLHHLTPPIEGHTGSHILRSIFISKKDFPLGRTPWYHLISIRPFTMPHYVSHLFSTLISVDKSHIVSWRSYPLSMHGQELRGDTHLLVMLWYQSGSMDSTQGYSLASWLDFQCLCWTSWWLSLPTPWSSPACQSLAWHCEIMGFSVQAATSIVDVGKCKGHWVGQGDVGLHCVCSELRVAWFHDKFWCWVSFSMVTSN